MSNNLNQLGMFDHLYSIQIYDLFANFLALAQDKIGHNS